MKTSNLSLVLLVLALGLLIPAVRAQFPNFPPANKVLGATVFFAPGTGAAAATTMSGPTAISIDPASGKLFVAVLNQHRILRFASATGLANGAGAETAFGQPDLTSVASGATASTFSNPSGVHVDGSGRLWVADYTNNRVLMFENAATAPGFATVPDLVLGQPDFTTVSDGNSSTKMNGPLSVFVDSGDNLWVAEYDNHRILKFASVSSLANGAAATTVLGQANFVDPPGPGTAANRMNFPNSVTVDGAGRLWVTDKINHRVLRFDNAAALGNGAFADGVLGQALFFTSGMATTAEGLSSPSSSVVDSNGTLFVADFANCRVVFHQDAANKVDGAAADGVIGQPDFITNTAGTTQRKLGATAGLAFDATGALWVADHTNNRLLRFSHDQSAAPPQLKGRVPKSTSASKVTLKGTASDLSGVASVRYRIGKGAFKNAVGTTAWTFKAKLKPGKNTIEVVVVDAVGNISAAKRVKVKRR